MGKRTYSFDAKMLLADGAAAITANGWATVTGVKKVIDLGGAPSRTDLGIVGSNARDDMACVVDISAMTLGANNKYTIQVVGSNNADLSLGQVLGCMDVGNTAALSAGGATSVPGRYEILFSTEQADVNYEYIGLYVIAVGTTPSIQFTAFGAVLPKI